MCVGRPARRRAEGGHGRGTDLLEFRLGGLAHLERVIGELLDQALNSLGVRGLGRRGKGAGEGETGKRGGGEQADARDFFGHCPWGRPMHGQADHGFDWRVTDSDTPSMSSFQNASRERSAVRAAGGGSQAGQEFCKPEDNSSARMRSACKLFSAVVARAPRRVMRGVQHIKRA